VQKSYLFKFLKILSRTGHPIADRLKLEHLPAGRQVTERKERTVLGGCNSMYSLTIFVIAKDEFTYITVLSQRSLMLSDSESVYNRMACTLLIGVFSKG